MPAEAAVALWEQGERALRAGRLDAARAAFGELAGAPGWAMPARLRLSGVATAAGRVREAPAEALAAFAARDGDPVVLEALAQRLVDVGELEAAVACATDVAVTRSTDPGVLAGMGVLMNAQALPALALPLLRRARMLGVRAPRLAREMGLALSYLGQVDAAERELTACVTAAPGAAPAWRDLARLRTWSAERNHVEALRAVLARMGEGHRDAPLLQYALFKELDDLGDTDGAWQALEAGMRRHRAQVDFDPASEAELFDALMESGPAPAGPATPAPGAPQPIFIVGLPRSGTTLLERVLGAHPQVADAGELRDFTAQLRWMADLPGDNQLDAALVRATRTIDFAELGERYLAHTRWHARGRPFYTDKLPANFLNAGSIARALPGAKILHMSRGPMDACFSNLKELFGAAYPHSYDQAEMAEHYIRYRRLMAHWHAAFPGRILDVSYEALAAEPERVAREVLAFCGLPWDDAVLSHERRGGAVATASTAQVREPIHARFVGQWRRYEAQLRPLRERLEAGGFEV